MPRLTKRVVDAAVPDPNGRTLFIWDGEIAGLALKVTPNGVKSYTLDYRTPNGTKGRYTIGRHGSPWTAEQARDKAAQILRDIADGHDPMRAKRAAREAVTVAELARLYLDEGPAEKPNKKQSSWKQDASQLNRHIVPLIGRRPVVELTADDVAKVQRDIAAGKTALTEKTRARGKAVVAGGPAIAARALAVLGAMLEFAVRRKLIPVNPARGVKLIKVDGRERFLSDRELAAMADALAVMEAEGDINRSMAAGIRLLALTGCRKSEILGLRWAEVDFDRAALVLPRDRSKAGPKVVALAAPALAILSELSAARAKLPPERRSPFVLPAGRGDGHIVGLQKAWEAVRARATALARQRAAEAGEPEDRAPDLSAVRLHDLRHSFASVAVAGGASLYVTGKLLGHKQARTTEGYAHLADDPLRAAAEATGARIAAALKAGTTRQQADGGNVVRLPVKVRLAFRRRAQVRHA